MNAHYNFAEINVLLFSNWTNNLVECQILKTVYGMINKTVYGMINNQSYHVLRLVMFLLSILCEPARLAQKSTIVGSNFHRRGIVISTFHHRIIDYPIMLHL